MLGDFGKFPGAAEINFRSWSQERLGLPLVLENDLRMALLGEWTSGAAQGHEDILMLALGTGIGCAAISGGRLLRGARNRAATLLGHSTVAAEGLVSRCGNIGCAEDLASTATLPQLARSQPDFTGSLLAQAGVIDFLTLFDLAEKGDGCSRGLLDQSLKIWPLLCRTLCWPTTRR